VQEQLPADPPAGVILLLGHPVAHSLSPHIHNAAFQHQKLDFVYVPCDVLPEDLATALLEMRSLGVRGANLTLPHKEAVLPLLDEVVPAAQRVGAVNTLVNDHGCLRGHNTDVPGFQKALRSVLPRGPRGLSCLIIGAGGAARAVVAALLEEQARELWIANRDFERAVALCRSAACWSSAVCTPLRFEDAQNALPAADLVVNATSLGLPDSVKDLPFSVDTLRSEQVVVDLVYGMALTPLVEAARAKGSKAIDGKEMLVQQAALSYKLWTGLEPPLDIMRGSVDGLER
jgi:shikimate dehydrogenase